MEFRIGNNKIGKDYPTYIIAEISCNHEQDINKALKLIELAKDCGANAVKFQTYTPDTMTIDCNNKYFKINQGTVWDGITLYELYCKAYTPWDWFPTLQKKATDLKLDFFSSPFDVTAVDFLENLNVPCYKIASFEVCDHVLLKRIAKTGKPVIMSSGVSDLEELEESLNVLRDNGCQNICLLKCTSSYPAPIENANLKTIKDMSNRFNLVSGLSDHTKGIEVPVAAVCLGAGVIEKHFKLEEKTKSPDDAFSLTPTEFKNMVDSIRKVEKAIGKIKYKKDGQEKKNQTFKRSLFVVKDMKEGDTFSSENIRSIRPGYGLHTRHYDGIIGKNCNKEIKRGKPLLLEDIK